MFFIYICPTGKCMYQTLTFYHSFIRWILLLGLIYALYRSARGIRSGLVFSKWDNTVRHWTATFAHVQLIAGILLYSKSPLIKYFWQHRSEAIKNPDARFFALVHILLMLTAIVLITIGSALAKRKQLDKDKFQTMLAWFGIALLIILIAIPWPFSPFANRPYWR